MRHSCFSCGYYRKEKSPDGSVLDYCHDRDCIVDPYEPECEFND